LMITLGHTTQLSPITTDDPMAAASITQFFPILV
jgi:hypothetical protein